MEKTVTLASYGTLEEAYIVKGMLEAHGVEAVVWDRNNLYVPVFYGVDLMVDAKDFERAQKLMDEYGDE